MTQQDHDALEARLARLERIVEELAARFPAPGAAAEAAAERMEPAPLPGLRYYDVAPDEAAESGWRARDGLSLSALRARREEPPAEEVTHRVRESGQFWLNRLGIALLLLGVALLFRYSIDQGWLTPPVRVGFGLAVGAVLLGTGLRIGERWQFSSVLVGGGIATFYITGFAAFNLYGLVGYGASFVGMMAITLLAFGLAYGKDEPLLAVLGALGGLGTPLILGLSYGTPRGFALYTCFILAWTTALYLARGWRTVLWTSLTGGWLLLLLYAFALTDNLSGRGIVPADPWVLQGAALFAFAATSLLPLALRVARRGAHERHWREAETLHWYGIALLPALAALGVSGMAWRPSTEVLGVWTLIAAAGYALAAWALWKTDGRIARVGLLVASVLASLGFVGALEGAVLLVAFAAQALALHLLAREGAGIAVRWMAHKVFVVAILWTFGRLILGTDVREAGAFADLAVIACALASSYLVTLREERHLYRYLAHVAWLGLLWRNLGAIQGGGEGYVTVAWGAYAVALLLLAMQRGWPRLEKTALVTLAAVVAKLFLVDLAALEAIYRVLLFLGFGSVFLVLSYWLQGWWKDARPARDGRPVAREATGG